jgi:hypothetical protein
VPAILYCDFLISPLFALTKDILLILIGIAFIFAGIVFLLQLIKTKREGIITTARISGYNEDFRGFKIYPVYEFLDLNQKLIKAESTFSIFTFQQKKVRIIYDPKNPKKVIPYHWLVMNGPIIVIIIGVLFILSAFI